MYLLFFFYFALLNFPKSLFRETHNADPLVFLAREHAFGDGDDSDASKNESLGEVVSSLSSSTSVLNTMMIFSLLFWFVLRQDLTM